MVQMAFDVCNLVVHRAWVNPMCIDDHLNTKGPIEITSNLLSMLHTILQHIQLFQISRAYCGSHAMPGVSNN